MSADQWIFFDLGWTLVDETAAFLERFDRLRRRAPHFANVSDEEFLRTCERHASRFASSPFLSALRSFAPSTSIELPDVPGFDHSLERLYPGVPDLLSGLAKSFRLGLIANQSAGTAGRLGELGIREAFSLIVSSTEVGLAKPDERIFALAESMADCRPEAATMVGDRLDNDIAPAKLRGWQTVRVLQGFSRYQQARSDAERPHRTIQAIGGFTPDVAAADDGVR
jgi:8-oxo-dGTP diphosphatase/putative hydrolase of the HAD superfamily